MLHRLEVALFQRKLVSATAANSCPADNRSSLIDGDVVSDLVELPPVQTLANVDSVEFQSAVSEANMSAHGI